MARAPKKRVERLPPITDPRRQLPFRFQSYGGLIADLGRTDALACSLTLSVKYFTDAAELYAKDAEEKRNAEARAAGEVEKKFTDDEKVRAMWAFGNREADRFDINTQNPAFPVLGTHAARLLLVGVYQQAEVFLSGVRDELKEMGYRWPQRGNHVPLLEYTLQHLPGALNDNKIKIGTERYDLFEYYRLIRNAFVHGPINRKRVAAYYESVKEYRTIVASEYDLDAPNPFESISFDDYHLFTRLAKYIATDICRIGEPTDEALVKRIKWKGEKVEMPLACFVGYRRSKARLRASISRWFKAHYALNLENRATALDALVEYVEMFPNQRLRRKSAKRGA